MIGLVLNSGTGSRMGDLTKGAPKCMTALCDTETILSRQLRLMAGAGLSRVVITTGAFDAEIRSHCAQLGLPLEYTFVRNPLYASTNYIYSIYLAREHLRGDILLMHGDLVFERRILPDMLARSESLVAVSRSACLPEKDFKATLADGKIAKIGIEFFTNAVASQPLYKLNASDWRVWLDEIIRLCQGGTRGCYAENALNEVSGQMELYPFDCAERLCAEIDTPQDLSRVSAALSRLEPAQCKPS